MFVEDTLLEAAQDVVHSANSCDTLSDRLTETHKKGIGRLQQLVDWHYKENGRRRDLKQIIKQALETQEACNPRPLVQLLSDAIFTVMTGPGNPGYENSPLVRVIMNTLLNIDGFQEHPLYKERFMQYHYDMDALEAALVSDDPAATLSAVKVFPAPEVSNEATI